MLKTAALVGVHWSDDDKARIVAESYEPGATVSEVARRHAMSPQQLFGWRRLLRRAPETVSPRSAPMFVPAVIEAAVAEPKPVRQSAKRRRRTRRAPSRSSDGIEFEIDGVVVRVGSGASPKAIAAVIGALKGGS
ncbi:transposase [Bosea eneae]|uniref:Transposase n=1 Tax=Bosea eneae TaxID=151454 RepID=A0ABW0J0Y5_9HYPH